MTDGPRASISQWLALPRARQEYDRGACMYRVYTARGHRSNIRDVNNATRARRTRGRNERHRKLYVRCEMETRCRCGNTTTAIISWAQRNFDDRSPSIKRQGTRARTYAVRPRLSSDPIESATTETTARSQMSLSSLGGYLVSQEMGLILSQSPRARIYMT